MEKSIKYKLSILFTFIYGFIIMSFLYINIIKEQIYNKIITNTNFILNINNKNQLLEILNQIINQNEEFKKFDKKIKKMIKYKNLYKEIKSIKYKLIKSSKNGKLIVSCVYSLNNDYVFQTLVSMTSLAENAGNNTFYNIYLLINPEFTEENKKILMTVEKKHQKHCKIIFINMGNKYKGKELSQIKSIATYYRLDISNVLPNVSKIIYMDGDTIVFQDLSEILLLDMKGNYIMGFLDSRPKDLNKFNIKNAIVLCAGVLLMDLDALRKSNMTEKFNAFLEANKDEDDQTTINVVCQKKISVLPPKYGIWNFISAQTALEHNRIQLNSIRYNRKEFLNSYFHPSILHYVCGKPFLIKKRKYGKEWWYYVKKSGYFDIINNTYKTYF